MKVLLYEGGGAETVTLPGEWPTAELAELLGGETEAVTLTGDLDLIYRADGWLEALECRYEARRLGREAELIPGPCAVVRTDREGRWRDVRPGDADRAGMYLREVVTDGRV